MRLFVCSVWYNFLLNSLLVNFIEQYFWHRCKVDNYRQSNSKGTKRLFLMYWFNIPSRRKMFWKWKMTGLRPIWSTDVVLASFYVRLNVHPCLMFVSTIWTFRSWITVKRAQTNNVHDAVTNGTQRTVISIL